MTLDRAKSEFLHVQHRYRGAFVPEHVAFNANLQEFSQRVGYICNLQTAGKLSPEEAYQQLVQLWDGLQGSHDGLGIARPRSRDEAA